jgi:hypothetical protein
MNVLLLAGMTLLLGCGYGFKPQGTDALPRQTRALFIDKVENPTTEAWLGPKLRSLFRDELTNRGWTQWTDRSKADGLVTITIHQFTREASVKDDKEDTTKYSSSVTLSVTIRDRDTGAQVWASGQVSRSDSYYDTAHSPKYIADKQAARYAIRRVADLLSQGY